MYSIICKSWQVHMLQTFQSCRAGSRGRYHWGRAGSSWAAGQTLPATCNIHTSRWAVLFILGVLKAPGTFQTSYNARPGTLRLPLKSNDLSFRCPADEWKCWLGTVRLPYSARVRLLFDDTAADTKTTSAWHGTCSSSKRHPIYICLFCWRQLSFIAQQHLIRSLH